MHCSGFFIFLYVKDFKGGSMRFISFIPILIGVVVILNRGKLLDYFERLNYKNERPVNRQIMSVRLLVTTLVIILIGLLGLLKII
jgi:hypothetical protein